MSERDLRIERAEQLRREHPDWSTAMILAAVLRGEDSPSFREAEARAASFSARFEATDGWMT